MQHAATNATTYTCASTISLFVKFSPPRSENGSFFLASQSLNVFIIIKLNHATNQVLAVALFVTPVRITTMLGSLGHPCQVWQILDDILSKPSVITTKVSVVYDEYLGILAVIKWTVDFYGVIIE